jgi:hypothetical protein
LSRSLVVCSKVEWTSTYVSNNFLSFQSVHQRLTHTKKTASNILDVPNFFWDSEPTLHPLYAAIREYLEIDPRIKVLNERCRVFLDLAEILSDSIADSKMSAITWIIIILIVVSILVTVTEVVLRFAMLQRSGGEHKPHSLVVPAYDVGLAKELYLHKEEEQPAAPHMLPLDTYDHDQAERRNTDGSGASDIEILAGILGLQQNASLNDVKQRIRDLKQREASCAMPLA